MNLPPRPLLRSMLRDAINDRLEMKDPSIAEQTADQITAYRALIQRLNDPRPLVDADHQTLAMASQHARIWRTTLLDAWARTGDKAVIKECRDDIARLRRIERALGITPHFIVGGPEPAGMTTVTVAELVKNKERKDAK